MQRWPACPSRLDKASHARLVNTRMTLKLFVRPMRDRLALWSPIWTTDTSRCPGDMRFKLARTRHSQMEIADVDLQDGFTNTPQFEMLLAYLCGLLSPPMEPLLTHHTCLDRKAGRLVGQPPSRTPSTAPTFSFVHSRARQAHAQASCPRRELLSRMTVFTRKHAVQQE
jgi:hypothetical protein